ncbi:Metal-binding protein [Magnetospirillum sp. LM-5]|uniref:DUF411 domain-containing protein n=1 Tax=Magnetospirillum sp. LM-5 TaxID=2681466 RepID=UPI00137F9B48|nr:DUF411 domain-containing protein [Magnetospirillum sp. LM-5]CAA7611968.1 Metal-binding protein [Magnetospirillum sp. LM-5]
MKSIVLALGLVLTSLFAWAADAPRQAVVYKNQSCGCCGGWVDYLRDNGWQVVVHDVDDLDGLKDRMGVPDQVRSCHTAKVGAYVIEGHVPIEAIDKLFQAKLKITGIAAPGMPQGSPGMSGIKEPNPIVTFGGGPSKLMGIY